MGKLKLEFMPEATRKNFERLKGDPRLAGFTLVGNCPGPANWAPDQ